MAGGMPTSSGYWTRSIGSAKEIVPGAKIPEYDEEAKTEQSLGVTTPSSNGSLKRKRVSEYSENDSKLFPDHSSTTARSRKPASGAKYQSAKSIIETDDSGTLAARNTSTPSKRKRKVSESPVKVTKEEKRLRFFRKKAPLSYLEKLERATRQRMFVIHRTRGGTDEIPEETIDMAGTTGNIYSITIRQEPRCTCPDNQKGNQCKHIVYVLHNVLKAPENLQYQLALLSSELRGIFANAPIISSQPSTGSDSNRKEVIGDCPICFTEFEPENEAIVWCKAACGNNIHQKCFEQWAKSQKGKEARCVYCRTPWQGDPESLARIKTAGQVNEEGYVNVGDQLGLSGERDYSTYHPYWVRRQFGGYY